MICVKKVGIEGREKLTVLTAILIQEVIFTYSLKLERGFAGRVIK